MVQMNSAVVGPISPLSIVGHEDVTVGGLEGSANLVRNCERSFCSRLTCAARHLIPGYLFN
jgi:hypothetical protein